MEEVDLRQFWGPEYRWEDSVPGMTEHEVVIEEEVAMTEEGEVSMRWALDSSKHIASDICSFILLNRVREGSSINTYSGRLSQGWVWLCCSRLARFVWTTYSRLPRTA